MTAPTHQLFPLIITTDLAGTKRFYANVCGCTATIEMDTYLQFRFGDKPGDPELCFMTPDAMPDGTVMPKFEGKGVVMSIPVRNADAQHAMLRNNGGTPINEPTDKPWGWRSFLIADPNGLVLDFFHPQSDNAGANASS